MKIGHSASGIGFDRDQRRTDPVEESEGQRAADDPVDQVADRQALGGRIAAYTAFEQRVQSRAQVGSEHHGKGRVRRHDPLGRKGHDQQYDSDTRMRRPGQCGG